MQQRRSTQGRPLVELSKRRGTWSADSAGWRRLPRDIYPPGLWAKKRTVVELDEAALAAAQGAAAPRP